MAICSITVCCTFRPDKNQNATTIGCRRLHTSRHRLSILIPTQKCKQNVRT